ncbi:MAG TPA: hypothetical protein DCZ49_00945 [Hyphomonadaceae bacterium]|nr:hypothetical protein [Hyphomonadaceae bacterium]
MTAEDMYRLGIAYSIGQDVDADLVAAHKWFNLAVIKGFADARTYRSEIAQQLSSAELANAQRAAREWLKSAN